MVNAAAKQQATGSSERAVRRGPARDRRRHCAGAQNEKGDPRAKRIAPPFETPPRAQLGATKSPSRIRVQTLAFVSNREADAAAPVAE
jgi:hypothetical protein